MEEPTFEVGDEVIFELCSSNTGHPRYECCDDCGGNGEYFIGKVIDPAVKTNGNIWIKTTCSNNGVWHWPATKGNKWYKEGIWEAEGYLRKNNPVACQVSTTITPKPCECEMDLLMTQGCQCGGK